MHTCTWVKCTWCKCKCNTSVGEKSLGEDIEDGDTAVCKSESVAGRKKRNGVW